MEVYFHISDNPDWIDLIFHMLAYASFKLSKQSLGSDGMYFLYASICCFLLPAEEVLFMITL